MAAKPAALGFATLGSVTVEMAHSLDEYLDEVRSLRKQWKVPGKHELWFRAEDAEYRNTHLMPGIYRPPKDGRRRTVEYLLALEGELCDQFERCATQLLDVTPGEDWEWEWYFLMQHHGVPTRLLDWSDGALIALHFAVRDKAMPPTSGSSYTCWTPIPS